MRRARNAGQSRADRNLWATMLACGALVTCMFSGAAAMQSVVDRPRSPLVLVVGCARETPQAQVWTLSNAGQRSESSRVAVTVEDRQQLSRQPLGDDSYQLIGVADFVDPETARKIGVRGAILPPSRVNATAALADGHKVGVKGLYIAGRPARINLTSVADLGASCP